MTKKQKKATHIGKVVRSEYGRPTTSWFARLRETPAMWISEDGKYKFKKQPKYGGSTTANAQGHDSYQRAVWLNLNTVRPLTADDERTHYDQLIAEQTRIAQRLEARREELLNEVHQAALQQTAAENRIKELQEERRLVVAALEKE
jgi:hypothetical protein